MTPIAPNRHPPGIHFDADRLRHEMNCRAINGQTLAAAAGISQVTMSAAVNGRSVSSKTAHRIADALAALPVVFAEGLLAKAS
jgi:hypothetical protein